ncbi:Calcium-transporting ATPase [Acaryochloris thomasi RCC1774]|uniref:Calcium-transporting ATPase n=1 Tax=Acaryochloris thomasi RCC1774 TaxID=1764569 RepID=A0A2W1JB15_9CYAN|nr:cation-translocating P-type ATPase [Acaryochloris thomasi]PZD71158.1 Calcium-transporting ATPase [Acaryochloris thomasi RCC1774]
MSTWYQLSPPAVLEKFGTIATGLSQEEAQQRLARQGPNELVEKATKNPWVILREQLTATMVLILIVAAVLSAFLGDIQDSIAIFLIVVFNAVLGFRQEYQAEQAIASLRRLAVPTVRVKRAGQVQELSSRELVPGDVVLLEAGNLVPADGRILESANLRVQEASLTGESDAVDKVSHALDQGDLPLGDRVNMVYMGTIVTYGRGEVVITETAMSTELGQIAAAIQSVKSEPTHLQKRLDQLGQKLAIAILVTVLIVFGLGLLRGEELQAMFMIAVSLGVAAVPEGLPAVVTIALSLGAQRMLKQQALIRKLPAVETLGSVTVICTDKTGTLTENRMTVASVVAAGKRIDLTQHPSSLLDGEPSTDFQTQPVHSLLLMAGTLCNDAALNLDDAAPQGFRMIGDPTEGALVVAAAQAGLKKIDLEACLHRIKEVPFDSDRKLMTTVHCRGTDSSPALSLVADTLAFAQVPDPCQYVVFCKGAVDRLLKISDWVWEADRIEQMTEERCDRILETHDQLAQEGMRLLGVAYQSLKEIPDDLSTVEQHLIFVGLVGMIDPIRSDVYGAVQTCQTAGIRPVMITGDHPLTAQHIAADLGIAANGKLLTGQDLDRLTEAELCDAVGQVSVYARVAPQHKLDIIHALQCSGQITAMTGDGVNDAPALKQADIGISMGITGTDVAKDASDIVLLDDNFSTIVAATREGRVIYDNIRKFILYTLTGNLGELWVILFAPFLGMPLPLLPLQILWINLLADGILALSLSVEPAERNIMKRAPYEPNESIFGRGVGQSIIWIGLFLGAVLLGVGYRYWDLGLENWQTMVFCTLAFSRISIAQAVRSDQDSLFKIGLFSNEPALLAVIVTFLFQILVVYVPLLQTMFKTVPLSATDLGVSLGLGALVFFSVEFKKKMFRQRSGSGA